MPLVQCDVAAYGIVQSIGAVVSQGVTIVDILTAGSHPRMTEGSQVLAVPAARRPHRTAPNA